MKSRSFPVETYEFTLSNKNQSVFVVHKDFPCSMPALQNLTVNSSTRGTPHFTRQPRSYEVAPTLRQFHFQTSVSSIIVPVHHLYFTSDVLKMIVCQMKPNECYQCYQYQIDGNQSAVRQKVVFVQFVPVFAYKCSTTNQTKLNKSMLQRPPSHLL